MPEEAIGGLRGVSPPHGRAYGGDICRNQSLAAAEADGQAFAAKAGCPDQTADCLRRLPAADLVSSFPSAAIPGVVDGAVLEEPIGTALAAGRFTRVPILNGINHDEERDFVTAAEAVSGGAFVPVPETVTAESYQRVIASVCSVPAARAAAIAAEYPLDAYPSPLRGLQRARQRRQLRMSRTTDRPVDLQVDTDLCL
jgi:para-nitrobenzyl esterase